MTNVLEWVEATRTPSERETPFTGVSPCTGESDLEILEAERLGVEALVNAYKSFCSFTESLQPYPEALVEEFVDGIQRAQLAMGTVRFYHALHREFCVATGTGGAPVSVEQKIEALLTQKTMLTERLGFLPENTHLQSVTAGILGAWDQMLSLTASYPDQHVHAEFAKGTERCEAVLQRLCTLI